MWNGYVLVLQMLRNTLKFLLSQAAFLLLIFHGSQGQIQTGFKRKIADVLSGVQQGCETTGYEERTRELCEEVVDRVCEVK